MTYNYNSRPSFFDRLFSRFVGRTDGYRRIECKLRPRLNDNVIERVFFIFL